MAVVLLVAKHETQQIRQYLQAAGFYDSSRQIIPLEVSGGSSGCDNLLCVPISEEGFSALSGKENCEKDSSCYSFACLRCQTADAKNSISTPISKLVKELEILLDLLLTGPLRNDVPTSWEKIGDVIVFSRQCFQDPRWQSLGDRLWPVVARCLGGSRVAVGTDILPDQYRSPNLKLVLGHSGWVSHRENGITYCLDVTKSMFASGNTTERMRVAQLDCRGETVVDLYAGVGYFVLPFLVHTGASCVHACEWNPHAVEGLRRGLEANGPNLTARCTIHFGDNKEVCPVGVADRVHLGLIPSSEDGWRTACRALQPARGGWMHVHGCPSSKGHAQGRRAAWDDWAQRTRDRMRHLLQEIHSSQTSGIASPAWEVKIGSVVHVKPYAPHIDHIVVDLECRPI